MCECVCVKTRANSRNSKCLFDLCSDVKSGPLQSDCRVALFLDRPKCNGYCMQIGELHQGVEQIYNLHVVSVGLMGALVSRNLANNDLVDVAPGASSGRILSSHHPPAWPGLLCPCTRRCDPGRLTPESSSNALYRPVDHLLSPHHQREPTRAQAALFIHESYIQLPIVGSWCMLQRWKELPPPMFDFPGGAGTLGDANCCHPQPVLPHLPGAAGCYCVGPSGSQHIRARYAVA